MPKLLPLGVMDGAAFTPVAAPPSANSLVLYASLWSDLSKLVPATDKAFAMTTGALAIGDGGAGTFYWSPNDVRLDNGGTICNPGLSDAGRWIRMGTEDGFYRAAHWGVSSMVADNSPALAPATAAVKATGGTLYMPLGTINHSQTWNLDDCRRVSIEGVSNSNANALPTGTTMRYTGNSTPAVSMLSAFGFSLKRICFIPASTFMDGGVVIECGHSNAFGNDSDSLCFEEIGITGWFNTPAMPVSNTIGLWLAYVIGAEILKCWFIDLRYSILGTTYQGITPYYPGESDYSAGVTIRDSSFGGATIYNPQFNWIIEGNGFEGPGTIPWQGGYAIDMDPSPLLSVNLTVRNNIFGDGTSADPWINLPLSVNPHFENNLFASGVRAIVLGTAYNVQLDSNYGVVVVDFTSVTFGVDTHANRGLVFLHEENAYIGLVSGYSNAIYSNSGDGVYNPRTEFSDSLGVLISGGLQLGSGSQLLMEHYSSVFDGKANPLPPWSPATINDNEMTSCVLNVGPTAGITPGQTVLMATLIDPNIPAGMFVQAYPIDSSTQARISVLNRSGAPYTPGALRVSAQSY